MFTVGVLVAGLDLNVLGRMFAAVVILIAYGFKYVGVLPTVLFAITDFAWGLIYIVGLQRLLVVHTLHCSQ